MDAEKCMEIITLLEQDRIAEALKKMKEDLSERARKVALARERLANEGYMKMFQGGVMRGLKAPKLTLVPKDQVQR